MMLYITSINVSWFYYFILSCMVTLPSAVTTPSIPFRVVFCIGVGWFTKSSIYGVMQHDGPESIIAYEISSLHALLAMSIAILSNALF
jgi:hypothetical protein